MTTLYNGLTEEEVVTRTHSLLVVRGALSKMIAIQGRLRVSVGRAEQNSHAYSPERLEDAKRRLQSLTEAVDALKLKIAQLEDALIEYTEV